MRTASASLLIFQHFLPLYPPLCFGDQSYKQVGMLKPWFSQHLQTSCSQRWAPSWPRLLAQLAYLQRHCSSRPSTRLGFETAKQIPIFLGPPCLQALPTAPHSPLQRLESLSLGMVVPCEFLWSQAGVVTAAWGGRNFISLLWRGSESIYLLFSLQIYWAGRAVPLERRSWELADTTVFETWEMVVVAAVVWPNMIRLSLRRYPHRAWVCAPLRCSLGNALLMVLKEECHCVGTLQRLPGRLYRFSWSEDSIKAFLLLNREKVEVSLYTICCLMEFVLCQQLPFTAILSSVNYGLHLKPK